MATGRRETRPKSSGLPSGKRLMNVSEDEWDDVPSDSESVSSSSSRTTSRLATRKASSQKFVQDERKAKRGFDVDENDAVQTPETDLRAGSSPSSPDARSACDVPWIRGFGRSRENRFRCKGAAFAWNDVDSEEGEGYAVPAYDLPPNVKLLKLSLDASVTADPTTLLQSYLDTLKAELPCGASAANVDEVLVSLPSSQKKSHGPTRCRVTYQAPLGDELHIGSSPQKTQPLSEHRFLGTLHFAACTAPLKAGESEEEPCEAATERTQEKRRHEDSRASGRGNATFGEERGIPAWQKEPSFMTWHRIKPYGLDGSSCPPRSPPERDNAKQTSEKTTRKGEEMVAEDGSAQERKSKEKRKGHHR
ncbi:hypothetical protein TGVAND_314470 [Toxoplasma gondii VAND]|uniref:Uncharacterized protein n=1 Tax=Toxoplasma gondii VAND TaxID=933077 RepID=A0A086QBL8_TOXGO|nr:hypothetical protein TGVAND_314470 [Toxoplasma gondii VAND]